LRNVQRILIAVACVSLSVACGGGDTPSREPQADYVERAMAFIPGDVSDSEEASVDEIQEEWERRAEAWDDLSPPPELAAIHERYGDYFEFATGAIDRFRAGEPAGGEEYRGIAQEWTAAVEAHYGVEVMFAEGAAMEPAFCAGDPIILQAADGEFERWQPVLFGLPEDPEREFFRRIVGLPGETIAIDDGVILINGAPLAGDQYKLEEIDYTVEPLTIPPARYYVLGDNRYNSFDSHTWRPLIPSIPRAEAATVFATGIVGELPPDARGCDGDGE
jgi:signal peptidase I